MHSAHCTLQNIFVRIYGRPIQFCVYRDSSVCRWTSARFVVVLVIYEEYSLEPIQIEYCYTFGVFRMQSLLLIDSRPSTYSYIERHSGVQSPVRFHANEKLGRFR